MNDPEEEFQALVILGCIMVIGATISVLGVIKLVEMITAWL
tara:strand:+ start:532 stop:654 length:123 start_codon:yes stop_codon:yes gene_type:complete